MADATLSTPLTADLAARGKLDVAGSVRDAVFAALVALGLFGLMIGFKTDQTINNQMVLVPRMGLLFAIVGIVFAVRLAMNLFVWRRGITPALKPHGQVKLGAGLMQQLSPVLGPGLILIAILWPIAAGYSVDDLTRIRYWVDMGTVILIYVMLGWGLNIVVGLAGLLDLGYVAFYAVGAYSYALLATNPAVMDFMARLVGPSFWSLWAFWICLPVAGILAAFWGMILGFPVLRLRGDYLAIVTLAFGEIIYLVLLNWSQVTGGTGGITSIPRPSFFGLPFNASDTGFATTMGIPFDPMHRILFLYYLIFALAMLTYWVTQRLRMLPVGRAWEALREDEIACRAIGMNTTSTKLTAFSIGAMFGGFAGAFFATRNGFISPESFKFMESAVILAIVVLGGMGSSIGVVIAAIALIGGMELLRELTFLKLVFGENFDPTLYRMFIFGLAMVAVMIWKPRGLISTREPTVFFKERKAVSGSLVKEGHG
jgi:branched-chain amino acid transport system permease protein